MAIALVANRADALGTDGGTTTGLDTSGANFLIVAISAYAVGVSGATNVTDNKGNTFTALTAYSDTSLEWVRFFYCQNANVGSGHTFTFSDTGTYCDAFVAAFSDVETSLPFDQQNGNGNGTSAGSVTPTEDNELVITAISSVATSHTPPTGFTLTDQVTYLVSVRMGGALAYKIQTTAGSENPAWAVNAGVPATTVATFKSSGAPPAGGNVNLLRGKLRGGILLGGKL